MIDRIQLVGTLGQHRLSDHQLAHQVDQLVNFLNGHADAGGLAGAGRLFCTLLTGGRLLARRALCNRRSGHRLSDRSRGGRSSLAGANRGWRFGKANLIRLDDEAEYGNQVVLAHAAFQRRTQRIRAFYHVAEGRQVFQLVFQQVDFALFQARQDNAQLAVISSRRRGGRRGISDGLGIIYNGQPGPTGRSGRHFAFRFQRQLAQRIADIFKAGGIRLLRAFIGVELFLHNIFGFQKQVDNIGIELHLSAPGLIQQVFHQVRGLLQNGKAKRASAPLYGVGRTKDGVELL